MTQGIRARAIDKMTAKSIACPWSTAFLNTWNDGNGEFFTVYEIGGSWLASIDAYAYCWKYYREKGDVALKFRARL